MSDLPPSTIPPDEDAPHHRTEDEENKDEVVENQDEQKPDDEDNEEKKEDEPKSEHEQEEEEKEKEPESDEEPKLEPEPEPEPEPEVNPEPEPEVKPEPEPEDKPEDEEQKQSEDEESKKSSDEEEKQESESSDSEQHKSEEERMMSPSRSEKEEREKQDSDSTDEEERMARRIGLRRGTEYNPAGPLTTVLVTREDDERKRQKINGKTKKQRMKDLAKFKSGRVIGGRGGKRGGKGGKGGKYGEENGDVDEDMMDSDDEARLAGGRDAPFLQQYKNKKRLEHILDEQHYWSDPEEDRDKFGVNDNMSSVFDDKDDKESMSGDDSDASTTIMGPDGILIRVKRSQKDKDKKGAKGEDIDDDSDTDMNKRRKLKRSGSLDSLTMVEDPNDPDNRRSKRRLHEHQLKNGEAITGSDGRLIDGKGYQDGGDDKLDNDNEIGQNGGVLTDTKYMDTKGNKKDKSGVSKTKMIQVKSHDGDGGVIDKTKTRNRDRLDEDDDGDVLSEFCDTNMDEFSDEDSGLDDDDEAVDVVLNKDQQQMIVNMLFDEEMNLRPEFARDENGRIIRRLDGSVIYDPHTGRFTFRRRLGQLFKVPRLKRNDKGRPTGGYIEDEFGPKKQTSSKNSIKSAKSGRNVTGTDGSESPASELKRSRGDGKNVGFYVPDDDIESLSSEQLDINKRGRRDITSAIRRKLHMRLFRKRRRRGHGDADSSLPDVQIRRAWSGGFAPSFVPGDGGTTGQAGMSPLTTRSTRTGTFMGTPGSQRRSLRSSNPEQWQMYRDGLQSDKKILEGLQDRLGRPLEPREGFVNPEGDENEIQDENEENMRGHSKVPHHHHGSLYYMTEDGRFVIRERNCPELKQGRIFTHARRPEDIEREEYQKYIQRARERNTKSAPVYAPEAEENGADDKRQNMFISNNSLTARSQCGSQMTSIDDNRLRRLLEELYRDKKYLDRYIDNTEPKSEAIIYSKGLAEHGRGYLMERADFWEQRGPLPPRPPMTDIGCKMQRYQTFLNSQQTSERGSTGLTNTPDIVNLPNVVESPRGQNESEKVENSHSPMSNGDDSVC